MQRFQGVIGIVLILLIAYLFSNNKKRINFRVIITGLFLQISVAYAVLKINVITAIFQWAGKQIAQLDAFAKYGASFVYGNIYVGVPKTVNGVTQTVPTLYSTPGAFVFAFSVTATLILVCILVALAYYFGIMQRLVSVIAKTMNFVMHVSGVEALSNVASTFVGQIEAQAMIRPYLNTMTKSELLASMSGSLACISGAVLVVYVNYGAPAEYLLAASLMAAPGALVISKIVFPETERSPTMGTVQLNVKVPYTNAIDAITNGAADGMRIAINIIAMLIGFMALIALINFGLTKASVGMHLATPISLEWLFSKLFYPLAWAMGLPTSDAAATSQLMGTKLVTNEFISFFQFTHTGIKEQMTAKGVLITSIALCGFANFSSVGMQIGGIGELAPSRRKDLAKLGFKALLCGTLASYLSAAIAGVLF